MKLRLCEYLQDFADSTLFIVFSFFGVVCPLGVAIGLLQSSCCWQGSAVVNVCEEE